MSYPSDPPAPWNAPLTVAVAAVLLLTTALADGAFAHGSTIDPASRNYGCWKRWGNDFQNPTMATVDPMCWQAWQADTTAMWNWNGLYRENVQGNHQAAVPNGTLCSAGNTGGSRYSALDKPGNWTATEIPNPAAFTVVAHDQARHGAKYFRVYVSRQGHNPLTQRLAWSDLSLLKDTGPIAPGRRRDHHRPGAGRRVDPDPGERAGPDRPAHRLHGLGGRARRPGLLLVRGRELRLVRVAGARARKVTNLPGPRASDQLVATGSVGAGVGRAVALARTVAARSVHSCSRCRAQASSSAQASPVAVAFAAMPGQSCCVDAFRAKACTAAHTCAWLAASRWFCSHVSCVAAATSAA